MVQSIKNLMATLLIAISGFLFWTEILPAYNLTLQLKATIQEKADLLNARMEIVGRIDKMTADVKNRYTELQRLALTVPDKKSIPELISAVESMFVKSGNIIISLELGDNPSEDKGEVGRIFVEIGARGIYANLIDLFEYLENNIRLFDVTSFGVLAETSTLEQPSPVLDSKITGNIYWIKPRVFDEEKTSVPKETKNGL